MVSEFLINHNEIRTVCLSVCERGSEATENASAKHEAWGSEATENTSVKHEARGSEATE